AERAMAVYGVLTGMVDIWTELYQDDPSGLENLQKRLRADGHDIDPAERELGEQTRQAIAIHLARVGRGLGLDPFDFLGEQGQFSMQSCSEFTPVLRLSRELRESLGKNKRRGVYAVNRRVLAYFCGPGSPVDGWWPCPRPGTGVDACRD